MRDASNEKLNRVKRRLEELIDDLDGALKLARGAIEPSGEETAIPVYPPWILQITRQREVLSAIVAIIDELRVESDSF